MINLTNIVSSILLVASSLFFCTEIFASEPTRQELILWGQNIWIAGGLLTGVFLCIAALIRKNMQLKKIIHEKGMIIDENEKKLQNSVEQLKGVFDTTDDFVFIKDAAGRFIAVNSSFEKKFAMDSRSFIGNTYLETPFIKAMTTSETIINDTDALVLKGETAHYELTHTIKGMTFVFDIIKAPLRNEKGEINGICGISRDITSRKETENQLRESESRFRELAEMLPLSVCEINSDMMIAYANNTALKTFGYTPDDLEGGVSLVQAIIPEEIENAAQDFSRVMASENVGGKEYTLLKKDGQRFPSMVYGAAIIKNGVKMGVRTIVIDVTAQKQLEEEKKTTQKRLEQAERLEAIGTLAGGIAHDFNNLLMGIQGYSSLVIRELAMTHPHYERLKNIEELVQSGANLTGQLLGFARGGRYEVKTAWITEIIHKTASVFGQTKKEISMDYRCDKGLFPVEVDQGQMEQVFLNLFVNAWQAMPEGGNILIESANAMIDEKTALEQSVSPGKFVKVSVSDTGTGIDETTKQHIFEPFFTTKKMGRGTGLGLASVYGIIKGHKGFITVDSAPGCGTTFSLYLPASDKKPADEKKLATSDEIFRGTETILVVDDEKTVLEINCEILESLGYRVYPAGSGQEALSVFMEKKDEIDLVILDMIMPGISGGETFDRLCQIDPHVRVLLSSGYSLNGEAKKILNRGCRGFLQKPFRFEELSQKVHALLAEEKKIKVNLPYLA